MADAGATGFDLFGCFHQLFARDIPMRERCATSVSSQNAIIAGGVRSCPGTDVRIWSKRPFHCPARVRSAASRGQDIPWVADRFDGFEPAPRPVLALPVRSPSYR